MGATGVPPVPTAPVKGAGPVVTGLGSVQGGRWGCPPRVRYRSVEPLPSAPRAPPCPPKTVLESEDTGVKRVGSSARSLTTPAHTGHPTQHRQ